MMVLRDPLEVQMDPLLFLMVIVKIEEILPPVPPGQALMATQTRLTDSTLELSIFAGQMVLPSQITKINVLTDVQFTAYAEKLMRA